MLYALKARIDAVARRTARRILNTHAKDIPRRRQMRALDETADYVDRAMFNVAYVPDRFMLLEQALREMRPGGLICEFGVYGGESINFIADRVKQPVYGFDSFEGLPEDWMPGFKKGKFAVGGLPPVRDNVQLIKGWFDATVPGWAEAHPGTFSFLHIDCDLYSSTRLVFDVLGDRIVPGTILVFDEYFNFPGWKQGEFKAFQELVVERGLAYEYLGYVEAGEQVALRVTATGATTSVGPSADQIG
jgi:hypothetical protein